MALLDHFAPNAGSVEDGGNGFDRIAAHEFTSVISVAQEGVFGTAPQALARIRREFNLLASDDAQLNLIRVALSGKTVKEDKNEFVIFLERALVAFESGHITQAELTTYLGL